ncbi:hypothetical protein CABS01_16169, partial [Colletotrichum abscissum]|uniref:uncharacterized protein n=1 Tax=Colletotrichum abscissum TaxID=1671311 RepID=UPI0027D65629
CLQVRRLRQLTHLLDPRRPRRLTTLIGTCLRIGRNKVVMHLKCLAFPQKKTSRTHLKLGCSMAPRLPGQEPEARNAPECPWLRYGILSHFALPCLETNFRFTPQNTLPMALMVHGRLDF